MLRVAQLSQHGLQRGLERVHLLKIEAELRKIGVQDGEQNFMYYSVAPSYVG